MADGTQQVTELNYTISLDGFGLALAYEWESYLLVFHWPKHVMCPSLSGMGKAHLGTSGRCCNSHAIDRVYNPVIGKGVKSWGR